MNKEKEFMKDVFEALKSDEYIESFKLNYLESLNNILLDNNKISLAIKNLSYIKKEKQKKNLKQIDYYPTVLSSIYLIDKYYDRIKNKDEKLLTILSLSSYYLVGINTDTFMYLFSDGILIDKLNNDKFDKDYLLEDMSKALNSFNKRKELEDKDYIKRDLINHSISISSLEPLFKMDSNTKDNALEITMKRSKK